MSEKVSEMTRNALVYMSFYPLIDSIVSKYIITVEAALYIAMMFVSVGILLYLMCWYCGTTGF